ATREAYLARFADQEGAEFLRRFHREYRGLAPEQVLERVLEKARPSPASVATVLASVVPGATPALLQERLDARRVQGPRTERELEGLLERHSPAALSLPDRGFVARVHPLELWLAAALYRSPETTLGTLLADSAETRQQVYGWLFRTRNRQAQDHREPARAGGVPRDPRALAAPGVPVRQPGAVAGHRDRQLGGSSRRAHRADRHHRQPRIP